MPVPFFQRKLEAAGLRRDDLRRLDDLEKIPTTRKAELRESEARTRQVLDSAPDAFITLDAEGTIRGWNQAAQRMFGWTGEEAIGQTMRNLLTPPEHRDRHGCRGA